MSKRHPSSELNVQSWLSRGDGQGEGIDYTPFFHPRDVPSRGRTRWFQGIFIPRLFVTLSDLEYFFVLLAEYAGFAQKVLDIREQVALVPWDLPQLLAETMGIRYPVYPGTRIPYVMTSDLVLTLPAPNGTRLVALCVKHASDLVHGNAKQEARRTRILEKLLIESEFWRSQRAEWSLCTNDDLPMILVKNLKFTRPAMVGAERSYLNAMLSDFVKYFCRKWSHSTPLNEILNGTAASLKVSLSDAFALFGRGIWLRQLPVNIHARLLHHEEPVALL